MEREEGKEGAGGQRQKRECMRGYEGLCGPLIYKHERAGKNMVSIASWES
jgi:hypothetical protein